jgi:flagellar hook assembly protein FlgD
VFFAKNYPNPFNPMTTIEWSIPRAGDLSIKIFNVKGELVRTLHDGFSAVQSGVMEWNGTNDSGRDVASGVYFYEVRSGDNVSVNKMALVK